MLSREQLGEALRSCGPPQYVSELEDLRRQVLQVIQKKAELKVELREMITLVGGEPA